MRPTRNTPVRPGQQTCATKAPGRDPRLGLRKERLMALILIVLLLALLLAGVGFAVHILWWIALVVLVLWLLGFLVRVGEGTSRSRWYRW
jgi:Flp pilus assembly protein TadB